MKRKILFVIPTLVGGGAEKVLVTILKYLSRDKYEITLFVLYDVGAYTNSIPEWINVIKGPKPDKTNIKEISRIPWAECAHTHVFNLKQKIYRNLINRTPKIFRALMLKRKRFDIEVAALEGVPCHLISNWGGHGIKWGWIHTDPIKAKDVDACKTYQALDKVICVSESVRELISIKYNLPPQNTDTVYNPIDTRLIITLAKQKPNIKKKGTTAIYLGRLSQEKGVERLIRAMYTARESNPHLYLWILGAGHLENQLKKLVIELQLANFIKFLGFVENPYPFIVEADFLVCPSDFEGFSLSIAESLLLQKPVVSTKTLGPTELLKNGELGILCETTEISLTNAILKMSSPEILQEYKENIAATSFAFDLNTSICKLEELLDNTKLVYPPAPKYASN